MFVEYSKDILPLEHYACAYAHTHKLPKIETHTSENALVMIISIHILHRTFSNSMKMDNRGNMVSSDKQRRWEKKSMRELWAVGAQREPAQSLTSLAHMAGNVYLDRNCYSPSQKSGRQQTCGIIHHIENRNKSLRCVHSELQNKSRFTWEGTCSI